tara:strand:+ start:230 stop:613 length:384 start_codon:yes stop_codon:yes gene_type:complete
MNVTRKGKSVMQDVSLKIELNPSGAQEMATILVNKEFRGRGDTLDAAFHRLQTRYGVSASLLDRLTSTYRDINDMKLSSYAAVFAAYQAAGLWIDENYEHQREQQAPNSKAARIADILVGEQDQEVN